MAKDTPQLMADAEYTPHFMADYTFQFMAEYPRRSFKVQNEFAKIYDNWFLLRRYPP